MAAADKTQTEWGYLIGGTDVDEVTVSSDTLWVKNIAFAGNAADATATLTALPYNTSGAEYSCMKFKVASGASSELDVASNNIFFGDKGIPLTNLKVTVSHVDDRLYIYLKF